MKRTKKLWTLAQPILLGLASCNDANDYPVVNPEEPDEPNELADYTIIFYGHDIEQAPAGRLSSC